MNLWLDDERPAPRGWYHATTVLEVMDILESVQVDEMSLDHDLGEGQPTGYDLVKWMCERNCWPRQKPRGYTAQTHRGGRIW